MKFNTEGEVALSLRAEDLEGNVGVGLLSWFVERKYDSTDNQRIVLPDSSIYQENNDSKIKSGKPIDFKISPQFT